MYRNDQIIPITVEDFLIILELMEGVLRLKNYGELLFHPSFRFSYFYNSEHYSMEYISFKNQLI